MTRELMNDAARQTTETASALLQALTSGDDCAIETAVIRSHVLARMAGLDPWTEERVALLDAVADAYYRGTDNAATRKLLSHIAGYAGYSGRVM